MRWRKIYTHHDLGIRIQFRGLQGLCRIILTPATARPDQILYYAVGTIDYKDADGGAPADDGHILYIKPAYHGTEGAGIRSYATAHRTFPHESTADQWFTESQFESYRSLGLDVANTILGDAAVRAILESFLKRAPHHTAAG